MPPGGKPDMIRTGRVGYFSPRASRGFTPTAATTAAK